MSNEPSGLSRSDGKRPDGLTLIPWRAGRSLIWDMTVSCTTAESYLEASSREAGAAAELAASNKVVKYAGLSSQGEFVPIRFPLWCNDLIRFCCMMVLLMTTGQSRFTTKQIS